MNFSKDEILLQEAFVKVSEPNNNLVNDRRLSNGRG